MGEEDKISLRLEPRHTNMGQRGSKSSEPQRSPQLERRRKGRSFEPIKCEFLFLFFYSLVDSQFHVVTNLSSEVAFLLMPFSM